MDNKKSTNSGRKLYIIISAVVFFAIFITGSVVLGPIIVKSAQNPERFRDYINSKGVLGFLIFIGIQITQVMFALIPGEIVEVGAGFAYGAWLGLLYCQIGVIIATIPIFFLTRTLGHKFLNIIIDSEKLRNNKILNNKKNLELLLFILYFIPGTPKDLITYLAGLTNIKPSVFFIINIIGRIPSILSSTYAGAALESQNYTTSIIIFSVSAVISIIGLLVYKHFSEHKKFNN
ncbi:MAG: VTT domain-containing protein [Oscillospiraceae bacterium]|nr:VTT domain-containing protein [Oscillospiraceae bacterium]